MLRSLFFASTLAAITTAHAETYSHPMAVGSAGEVVTCEKPAADIGIEILRRGGNAADAYVATTLAEYVDAYGYTSLSGPLGLLYYDAKSGSSHFLNAGLNKVSLPDDPNHPTVGEQYAIGGAGFGLEALFRQYGSGKLTFEQVVAPAARLARKGFPLIPEFSGSIYVEGQIFKDQAEWMKIYEPGGKPLGTGAILRQPELARTLERYGKEGAAYLFKGKFADDLVRAIQANGGKLTREDLAKYEIYWTQPLAINYRGFDVLSSSYRSGGGLELFLALKTIENDDTLAAGAHYSADEAKFATVVRAWLFAKAAGDPHLAPFTARIDELGAMESFVTGALPTQLWGSVTNPAIPVPGATVGSHHSCNTIVIDRDGNIATGTHTINSTPWGAGLMVDGVSVNTALPVTMDAPPGTRAIDTLTPVLIFKDGRPWAAAGFFDGALQTAAFQVLLNLMDYNLSPYDALMKPRFGETTTPLELNFDPRLPTSWIPDFAQQGITLFQPTTNTYLDTGEAMVIRIDPATGLRSGSATELMPESLAIAEKPPRR